MRGADPFVTMLCSLPFVLAIAVPIGGVVLRAAVSVTNRILGAKRSSTGLPYSMDLPLPAINEEADANPFSPPGVQSVSVDQVTSGIEPIPEPKYSRACGIFLVAAVIYICGGLTIGFLGGMGRMSPSLLQLYNLFIGFVITVWTYKYMPANHSKTRSTCLRNAAGHCPGSDYLSYLNIRRT